MLFGKKKRRITRLLIVEDEPLIAFDTEHFLIEEGFVVVATTDSVGEAIGHLAAPNAIDLVLVDLGLREGSGADVAHVARAQNVPALLATGQPLDHVEAIAMGYRAKPYPLRHLLAAIEAIEALLDGKVPRRLPAGVKLFQTTA